MATQKRTVSDEARAAGDPAPNETRLDTDVETPSTVVPGDAPADTKDPAERAVSVAPQPSEDALLAGTVNAVLPVPEGAVVTPGPSDWQKINASEAPAAAQRVEEYPVARPDGTVVTVRHNLDTGKTEVV